MLAGALEREGGLEIFGKLQNLSSNFKVYMFSALFEKKLNFQLTCSPWRWYLRSNLMKTFSDAVNTKLRRDHWFFHYSFGFIEKQTPIFRLLKWSFLAFFHYFLIFRDPLAMKYSRFQLRLKSKSRNQVSFLKLSHLNRQHHPPKKWDSIEVPVKPLNMFVPKHRLQK